MSLRKSIDAKCRDCICDETQPGTWREQIAACTSSRCPLWPVRAEPHGGRMANPPRDPEKVTQEWLSMGLREAILGSRET